MPTSKPLDYTPEQISISLTGRAIGHACRVKIMDLIVEHKKLTNKDLTELLKMSKSTVHDHLVKLWDADLITLGYHPHELCIGITKEQILKYKKLNTLFNFKPRKKFHLSHLD